jgi:hypothetical protein
MKFVDRLKFTTTGTSAASISDGTAVTGCGNIAAKLAGGALALTDTSVPFGADDGAGNWELSLYNLGGSLQAPTLTRTAVLASSAGGTTPATFTGATLTVFNTIPSSFLNGVSLGQLPNAGAIGATDVVAVGQSGNEAQTTVDAFYTYLVNRMTAEGKFSAPAESLSVTTPSMQTVGSPYTLAGTWAGVQPTALDYMITDSGVAGTWNNAVSGLTIGSNGTWQFSVTPTTSSVSRTISVRDHNNTSVVSPQSGAYIVNPNTILNVTTPGTQTVGTAFTLSGTYTGTAPASLDYQQADGTWVQASSPVIGSGSWSFSVTPTTPSSGRTISVRDHTYVNIVGTSGTYAVNAAASSTITNVSVAAATSTVAGGGTDQMTPTVTGTGSYSSAVTYSIDSGGGSINSSGLYTAPAATASDQPIVIRATSVQDTSKYGTVTITVPAVAAGSTVTSVNVAAALTTVQGNQTDQLTATVNGTNSPSQGVTWTIQSGPGSVNSSGLYTAPPATNSSQTTVVKATSTQDTSKSGTVQITIAAQPTVSNYNGTIKSTLTASDAYGISNGKELYTGSNTLSAVWVFAGSKPNTASTGWSQSNTVAPAAITMTDRGNGLNGMLPMTIANPGSGSSSAAYLYVPVGSGTTTWYFWMEINGIYTVMNPSGTVVTV